VRIINPKNFFSILAEADAALLRFIIRAFRSGSPEGKAAARSWDFLNARSAYGAGLADDRPA